MTEPSPETKRDHDQSFVRKLLDSPFILLILSVLVTFLSYTIWGVYELANVPPGTLPTP